MRTKFLVVDLFCGAGGTSSGYEEAYVDGEKVAEVIACVNHDANAIASHYANYPHVYHFTEDIRKLKLRKLLELVNEKRKYWEAKGYEVKIILWASLECTNFSNAKGGKPRDADSRTLAEHLFRYIDALKPEYIKIENVREFMAWGPLSDKGKPLSRDKGRDYLRWVEKIKDRGYAYDFRLMNSADYGAHTSRIRYFGMFAKHGQPISFPQATHAKNPEKVNDLFGGAPLKKWRPVKEVLDFSDEGKSIFGRKKALSEKTLQRIYAGLIKYVAGGMAFVMKNYSGHPEDKVISIDGPAGTITTADSQSLVQAFMMQRNSGDPDGRVYDVEQPSRTLTTTGGNQHVVKPKYLMQIYGANSKGDNVYDTNRPARTITSADGHALVQASFLTDAGFPGRNGRTSRSLEEPSKTILASGSPPYLVNPEFLTKYHGSGENLHSIEEPASTLSTKDRLALIQPELVTPEPFLVDQNFNSMAHSINAPAKTILACRKNQYLVNPQWGGHPASVDEPAFTLIARMDKAPPYLVITEAGELAILIEEGDSEWTVKIKQFMADYGLVDIKMRMLRVRELLSIQGFPKGYVLKGNDTQQKKQIGNSVVPGVVKHWAQELYISLKPITRKAA